MSTRPHLSEKTVEWIESMDLSLSENLSTITYERGTGGEVVAVIGYEVRPRRTVPEMNDVVLIVPMYHVSPEGEVAARSNGVESDRHTLMTIWQKFIVSAAVEVRL